MSMDYGSRKQAEATVLLVWLGLYIVVCVVVVTAALVIGLVT